ncbi:MAG: phosphoribosyltransferase [Bacteroidia bacterium]|nr:phosphoribosyltransferase [Bacteroidia bacterium]
MKTQILAHAQVQKIIKRMAYQIFEKHFDQKELVFAGIVGQGVDIAKLVQAELQEISKIKVHFVEVKLSKDKPAFNSAEANINAKLCNDKAIVLFDDVLNTGRTLVFGMHPFLQFNIKSIHVAVLVDRNHRSFPVSADFIGLSLQTTLQDHVNVTFKANKVNVYLQ